jgi:hypothetical protein
MTAICAGGAGAAPGDIEIPLTAGKPTYRNASILQSASRRFNLQSAAPAGQWKLPDFGGRKAAFATLRIGGMIRLLAFDTVAETDSATDSLVEAFGQASKPESKFYNRMYFDANGNSDLTDDPVIKATPQRESGSGVFSTTFTQVSITNNSGENASPYFFNLTVTGNDNKRSTRALCHLSPGLIYTGTASLEGVNYYLNMVDDNMNGSFTDTGADKLYLSDNKQVADMYPLPYSDLLVIGTRSYTVKLDAAASKLILSPATGLKGKLLVSESTDYLTLKAPGLLIAMLHPSVEVAVPAGAYTVTTYRLSRKDAQNRTWYVESKEAVNALSTQTSPTNAATLPYGEPFEVILGCKPQYRGKDSAISMSFKTIGKGKENVAIPTRSNASAPSQPASFARSRQAVTPSYQITDSRGALITKGRFQLG